MPNFFSRFAPSPAATNADLANMPKTAKVLGTVIDVCLHATIFLVPLFFTSFTLDVLELSKQTLLVILASVAFVSWLGIALAEKRFSLSRNWVHLVVVLFGLGYLVVALMSGDKYLSLAGALGQMPWAFATIATLVMFYLVIVHRVRSTTEVYNLIFTFLLSSLLVGLFGVLQMFGIYLIPAVIAQNNTFTSIGSVFAFSVFMVVPLVMCAALAFHGCRNNVCLLGAKGPVGMWSRIMLWVTGAVALLSLIMVDFWVAWVALLFGTALTVGLGFWRTKKLGKPTDFVVPAILVISAFVLLFFRTPVQLQIPAEVAPSALASWNIAKQALQDHPLFGSGPGTWLYDYAQYRVQLVNLSPFWTTRFDRAFSAILTMLATTGIVGVGLWFMLVISAIVKAAAHLMKEKSDDVWYAYLIVFVGWLTMTFVAFFYNYNMVHQFLFWFLLALLGSMVAKNSLTWNAAKSVMVYGMISTLFVVTTIGGVSVAWLAGQRFVAEVEFSSAVALFRGNGPMDQVIASITSARSLNPFSDLYVRNLSQAHLIKAAGMMQGGGAKEQAGEIQNEIKQAVDIGIEATSMNPVNVDNWTNLALVYQNIASFTRGADEFAIKNFLEAHKLEPQNPVFLNEVGKLYLLRADAYRTQLGSSDAAANQEAQKNVDENLNMAIQYLMQSIASKPDYLPSRYYLGLVYERQGKVSESITELENVLRVNNQDVGVGFELSIMYYRNGQKDQALNLLEQIVGIDPNNSNARWYLSSLYEERGRLQDALKQIQALAEILKGNVAVEQRLNALQTAVQNERGGRVQPLPEPLPEKISSPPENNPVQ